MRFSLLLSLALPVMIPAGCLPVAGDRILGRDLALADNRFSPLPATAQFGYAPVPGTTRIFTAVELRRLARANGIGAAVNIPDFTEVCFEVPLRAATDAEFIESMRRSLPREVSLRLADIGRASIPSGRIEFPLSGLEPPATGNDGSQLWRGFVQYTDTRKMAVGARVVIAVTYAAVVARKDLGADTPIETAALRIETKAGALKRQATATRIEEVAGRVVRRPVKAGAEIPLSLLGEPPAVRRGDLVRVEVRSGLAVLRFDAIAQATVRAGEIAEFRNPITGKTFRARAETGSRAVVVVGNGAAL
jgi:flagella basal body P-ring formation protein FlgA